jgi:NADPH:quinone reductase-like Zn-dependent oxidoreductase
MKTRKLRIHRFGGPDVLRVEEVEPSMPDALQVLVSVKAASVNPVGTSKRRIRSRRPHRH